jgi:hypothetical protein
MEDFLFLKTQFIKGKIMKSKKSNVSAVVFYSVIIALALGLPNMAFALQSGDFTYAVSGNTVTIIGYTGGGGIVVIPDNIDNMPVVAIGDQAFEYRTNLISVTIPNSVRSIGMFAFENCDLLNNVTIGNSVVSIGSYAFFDCHNLTKAYFLGNAPSIGQETFYHVSSNFTVCYTAGSTGFTNPWCFFDDLWQEWYCYPARVCGETTSTTIPGGTTTTTISSGPCAAEAIYGENSEQTALLREYRDNVLSKTTEGQELIKTYYKFSPTVRKLLEQRPLLKNRAKAFIDSMLPEIRKKVEECK